MAVDIHLLLFAVQEVSGVVVARVACAGAVEWTAEVPEASVVAEVWTVEASEDGAWTEEDLVEGVVVDLQMIWEGGGEEWDHLVKWI